MKEKFLAIIAFLLIHCFSFSQPKIDFISQKTEKGVGIFANNPEYCPVSVKMTFKLTNMIATTGNQEIFVVPAKTNNYLIAELQKASDNSIYKYSYKFQSNFGDITLQEYDTAYEYDLPFEKGSSCKLWQGYFGSFSHQTERALDFSMPDGSNIVAARDGVVVSVVQSNTQSCPNKSCLKYNNFVNVYHSDGTFVSYCHIQFQGSKVKVGDKVKQGDVIALSGHSGFTSGSHLHFACFLPGLTERRTVETYFKIDDGSEVSNLQEGETYFKNY